MIHIFDQNKYDLQTYVIVSTRTGEFLAGVSDKIHPFRYFTSRHKAITFDCRVRAERFFSAKQIGDHFRIMKAAITIEEE